MPELNIVDDRIVTVFVVDKILDKINKTSKDYIIKMLTNTAVNIQTNNEGERLQNVGNFITNPRRLHNSDKEEPTN